MLLKIIRRFDTKLCPLEALQKRLCSLEVRQTTDTTYVPDQTCSSKLLKVAIIGAPNAGKSTVINSLMDRKVCATSSKVHTTRKKSTAIFTEGDAQIVFLDTPGLVNERERKKFNLENTFIKDSKTCLQQADIIGVIHDVSNQYTREILDIKIIRLLEDHKNKSSFLVLNKIDLLKSKRKLLDVTRILTENCLDGKPYNKITKKAVSDSKGWPYFKDIFMISALTGSGTAEIKDYLIKAAQPNQWLFPSHAWTNETTESVIVKAVQAKLLDFLPQEIPYNLTTELEFLERNENTGVIACVIIVKAPTDRIARLVAGASDGKLRQITESLQDDLQQTFQNFVRIKIVVEAVKRANKV